MRTDRALAAAAAALVLAAMVHAALVLPDVRHEVSFGLEDYTERLPRVVMILFLAWPPWAAIAASMVLLASGLATRRRALLVAALAPTAIAIAVFAYGTSEARRIAFGPDRHVCDCGMVAGQLCTCDGADHVVASFSPGERASFEHSADGRVTRVVATRPDAERVCVFNPPCTPDRERRCDARCTEWIERPDE